MRQTMHRCTALFVAITVFIPALFMARPGQAQPQENAQVGCRLEANQEVVAAGNAQNLILKVSLDAPPAPPRGRRPAVNLALVLDRSGSMAGRKMAQARAAALEALHRLDRQDLFSLVTYNSTIKTHVPAQSPLETAHMEDTIRRIQAGGNTALFGGVSQGAAEIRKHLDNRYVHRIILLSDGLANVGPSTPEDLGRLGAALLKENISVSTVGVGVDYNEDLMARLSQKSDGNTYFVESEYDLPAIFAAELGDVLSVVAKKVKVIITLDPGITPVAIIGREGRILNNRFELSMNQLYGGQEKYALVEVRLPASRTGEIRPIGRADVYYQDPFTLQQVRSTGTSRIRFSNDPETVAASENIDVVRDYQLNLNALAQEKAIELSDKGKPKEAVAELKKSAHTLKALGAKYKDTTLLEEAAAIETRARRIEDQGMSKKSRKELRTNSFQMKNQQILKKE